MIRMTAKEAEHILIHMGDYIEYDDDYGCLFKPKLVDASARAIKALRAEAAHGRWIWKNGKCFCSACSKQGEPKQVYQDGTIDEYPQCPNCGAKMDLE